MDKQYKPRDIEQKIYESWEKHKCFLPKDSASKFSIVLPPPNVTGTLHMGHAFQHTIIDVLVRYHRMLGKSVLWQPGTDHAGIATQLVVENRISNSGINPKTLSREKFIDEVWKWKELSGNSIINQTKRIGSSADWSRNRFTMDDGLSEIVRNIFIELYNNKLIYRGNRLVNWDIKLQTAISDLEVVNEEREDFLYHLEYGVKDSVDKIIVATTRPETFFGDSAVCVNPSDTRHNRLIGKKIILPMINREIPIIGDDIVDMEFGTGCLKITPAHDFNDYKIGKKHNLEFINILNKDGGLNENVAKKYIGRNIHDVREDLLEDLESLGVFKEKVPYKNTVPVGERTGEVIEPLLTNQWFMNMNDLAKDGIRVVKEKKVNFVPEHWEKIYFNWLENIEDWCVSRQIVWGHRIPAWYDIEGNVYVGNDEEDIRIRHNLSDAISLSQDTDVLDTWFSSALWPFSTLDWKKDDAVFQRYFPTNLLVTGFDIIFFWVARMIMMSLKFTKDIPFKKIYIHGLVRDSEGKKMSKSIGNVIDPLDVIEGISLDKLLEKRTSSLINDKHKSNVIKKTKRDFPDGIKEFGADALRFNFCAMASTGRDINFDLKRIEGYRNFCNKIWNASRFILLICKDYQYKEGLNSKDSNIFDKWILYKLDNMVADFKKYTKNYRFDLMANSIYDFVWNEYCDWYLEIAKNNTSETTKNYLIFSIVRIIKICHPIIPFITEDIWKEFYNKGFVTEQMLINSSFPTQIRISKEYDVESRVENIRDIIRKIRKIRAELSIHPKEIVSVKIFINESILVSDVNEHSGLINNMTNIKIEVIDQKEENLDYIDLIDENYTLYLKIKNMIDANEEMAKIDKKITDLASIVNKIDQKLNNKKFIERAPSDIINQNISNKAKIENDILSLRSLRDTLSD
jgi:valyl-tRNA synthetase|tara:strand:- start:3944 stop:6676 length:2733 start_codon:yes stop_codon:yes gene_type:complete